MFSSHIWRKHRVAHHFCLQVLRFTDNICSTLRKHFQFLYTPPRVQSRRTLFYIEFTETHQIRTFSLATEELHNRTPTFSETLGYLSPILVMVGDLRFYAPSLNIEQVRSRAFVSRNISA